MTFLSPAGHGSGADPGDRVPCSQVSWLPSAFVQGETVMGGWKEGGGKGVSLQPSASRVVTVHSSSPSARACAAALSNAPASALRPSCLRGGDGFPPLLISAASLSAVFGFAAPPPPAQPIPSGLVSLEGLALSRWRKGSSCTSSLTGRIRRSSNKDLNRGYDCGGDGTRNSREGVRARRNRG